MLEQLEQLYQEARSALKAKDYDRASGLLRQILQIDENYKDASRLLAQTVTLRRRRWYNDPRLWGTLAGATIIGLLVWGIPKLSLDRMFASPAPSATVTSAPPNTPMPTQTVIPTVTFTPAPTPVPLAWKRISIGQEFPRDTVSAIVVDPNDSDVIYVGMSNAGIYKSIDGGVSWRPAFSGIRSPRVWFLHIDPKNPQTLYASFGGESNFISTDGGENWQRANPETAQHFFLDPQNNAHLFAWSRSIFESVDGGKTWTTNYQSMEGDCPQSFGGTETAGFLNETSTLYLLVKGDNACPTGIYQSKDAGHTWTFLYGDTEEGSYQFDIGRDSQGSAVFYVGASDGTLISYDQGQTWMNAAPEYCEPLVVDAESPATAYCAGDTSLLVTEDGGHTWSNFGVETNFGIVRSIYIDHPRGTSRILVGGTNGLFASTDDGNSWIEMANGVGATNLQVRTHPSDNSIMFADAQAEHSFGCSLFRSQDHGKTWNSILTSQSPSGCEPEFDVNGNIYLIQDGSIVMSSDKGDTWQSLPKPYGVNNMSWVNVSQYQSAPLFGGDLENGVRPLRVFYSNNIGNTWTLGSGVDVGARGGWELRLLFDPQGKYIYAQSIFDVFRSENGGMTWFPCAADNMGSSHSDTSLAINPNDGANFFLATTSGGVGGLYFTLDACQTWQKTSLDSLFVNTVAIDPIDTNIIYAGTGSGAYVSFDSGQTWNQINNGLLGATVVYSIAVDKDSNVYAATPYGIFKLEGK